MRAFEILTDDVKQRLDAKCWKGYRKQGTKVKGDTRVNNCVKEAAAPKVGRAFQHAEDMVIVDGSRGALEALSQLASMADSVDDVTVKWDGSPAVFFGRNENGQFVLTDGAGFAAKGYNGKVTSAKELEQMFLGRGKPDPEKVADRQAFAGRMASLWPRFEQMVEPNFRGYIKGDLLYFTQPVKDKTGDYVFTPNTVTYSIPSDSTIGQKITKSTAGIVVHSYESLDGTSTPISGPVKGIKQQGPVMIQGPVVVNHLPSIDTTKIDNIKRYVTQHAQAIDSLLDDTRLAAEKMSDLKNTLYTFVNQQVDTGNLRDLNKRFDTWLASSKVSAPKQAKFAEYRQSHADAFEAVFSTLEQIMAVKDDIIDQLDQNAEVKASVSGKRGGEGYVKGSTKLVPRLHFTAANRAKHA